MSLDEMRGQTVGDALRSGAGRLENSKTPLLDARVLLKFVSGLDDAGLIAKSADALPGAVAAEFSALIERRSGGEPVAYITGVKEFWSLEFDVTPDVLIPRDDSESLIEAIVARRSKTEAFRIVDLGTGAGCLLCALLSELPESTGTGVDRSEAALAIATQNCESLGLSQRADFMVSDWSKALAGPFDIVIANPPYIPEGGRAGLPVDVVAYEPEGALFAGEGGLDAYRAILADAGRILAPDGLIVFEMGADQASALRDMVTKTFPEAEISTIHDLEGRPRGILADRKSFAEKD